jgi:hypothetical protein
MSDAPLGVWIIILIIIANALYKAYKANEAKRREENFKHTNPKEYAQLKQIEHEKQLMQHQKVQMGAGIFRDIFRMFGK